MSFKDKQREQYKLTSRILFENRVQKKISTTFEYRET